MMARRRFDDRPDPWWKQVISAWPLIIATLTIIAFILNAQRDIAEMKARSILNTARIQTINERTDSLAKSAEIRDYMICKVFEALVHDKQTTVSIPRRCDDVFQGWGTR
jgi:hypothetical protein